MAQFKAFSSGVEVNGETVLSIVDGMGAFRNKALAILKKNGIEDPKPGQWYLQQAWLDSFKEIADSLGAATLYQIGMKIPENANFPPQVNDPHSGIAAIDMAYHMNHRGGEIGKYGYEKTGDKSVTSVCPNPYPCDFDKGIIFAMANKFKPPGSVVKVEHDDSQPCRKKGGESCTYKITW